VLTVYRVAFIESDIDNGRRNCPSLRSSLVTTINLFIIIAIPRFSDWHGPSQQPYNDFYEEKKKKKLLYNYQLLMLESKFLIDSTNRSVTKRKTIDVT